MLRLVVENEVAMEVAPLSAAVSAELSRLGPLPGLRARMADGIVTLSGAVPDEAIRRRVEQQLLALPDVMDVHNYLKVEPPCDGLEDRLLADLAGQGVEVAGLHVDIKNGLVSLSGLAANWFDRDAMARLAWTLPGVREVDNRVKLPPGAVEPDRDANGNPIP